MPTIGRKRTTRNEWRAMPYVDAEHDGWRRLADLVDLGEHWPPEISMLASRAELHRRARVLDDPDRPKIALRAAV